MVSRSQLVNVDELNMNDVILGYDVTLFRKYVDCTESSSPCRVQADEYAHPVQEGDPLPIEPGYGRSMRS